jgi:hypothetical protein
MYDWGMARVRRFFKSMFSELGSGLSGPASVPFAIASLWVSSPIQRFLYGALAGILLLVSSYRIWAKQEARAHEAESELASLKQRYLDECPQLGLEIAGPQGPTAWRNATTRDACWFWLQHLSGRTARSIRFDPIPSKGRRFTLYFDDLPFLEPSPRRTSLTWHVREVGVPRLSAHDWEKIGDIEGQLLGMLLDDSPPGMIEIHYKLTVRFKDVDEERMHHFSLVFDKTTFMFLPNTEQPDMA